MGRLDGGSGSLAWHLDGYDRETRDLRIPGFATADPDERSPDERRGRLGNSYSDSSGSAAGLSWITDRGYLGVGVSILDSTYGLPGPAEEGEEEEPGEDPLPFPGPYLDLEQTRVDVRGLYRFSGVVESVKIAFGTNDYEHVEVEPSGEPGTVFDNQAWQLRAEDLHHGAVKVLSEMIKHRVKEEEQLGGMFAKARKNALQNGPSPPPGRMRG